MSFTVVVVDDEIEILKLVAEAFNRLGAVAHMASSGAEALRLLSEHKVDSLVTDVRMPRMTGLELLAKVRAADFACPLVGLMSGYADMTLDEVYDLGAAALFSKPVSPRLLAEETLAAVEATKGHWKAELPVESQAAYRVSRKFKSLKRAKDDRVFGLGHGGIFVGTLEMPEPADADDPIESQFSLPKRNQCVKFRVEFEEGPLKLLEGVGISRWVRRNPKSESGGRSGFGVELRSLSEACREEVVAAIRSERSLAYIPKG